MAFFAETIERLIRELSVAKEEHLSLYYRLCEARETIRIDDTRTLIAKMDAIERRFPSMINQRLKYEMFAKIGMSPTGIPLYMVNRKNSN
jgi:hypothetical protein